MTGLLIPENCINTGSFLEAGGEDPRSFIERIRGARSKDLGGGITILARRPFPHPDASIALRTPSRCSCEGALRRLSMTVRFLILSRRVARCDSLRPPEARASATCSARERSRPSPAACAGAVRAGWRPPRRRLPSRRRPASGHPSAGARTSRSSCDASSSRTRCHPE